MTEDDIFNAIELHAKDGVDFMTIHAGITKEAVEELMKRPRVTGIVSRGGAFLAAWMLRNESENPLYRRFDYLLEMAREYDFCISLGDGLRPGCIADALDYAQIHELLVVSRLVKKCREAGVQCIVEGPGHVRLDQIEACVKLEKALCEGAPFYVLGPLPTDVGASYDHIVGAIGGAIAGMAGADFLCYVTPSEHLGLPLLDEVRERGVSAMKLAAHCADIVRLGEKAYAWDLKMAEARARLDWESQYKLSIDSERARAIRERVKLRTDACSMCGDLCVFKIIAPTARRRFEGGP